MRTTAERIYGSTVSFAADSANQVCRLIATGDQANRRSSKKADNVKRRRPTTTSTRKLNNDRQEDRTTIKDKGTPTMTEAKAEMGGTAIGRPPTSDLGTDVYRGRSPGPYVPGTSWRTWWKLFSNFLVLRKVTEEREQRLIFLQEVGNSNYELLESLLQGRELEDVELKDLRQAMERHYQPKKLVLAERFGLMSKVQKPGQALHEYYAELQKAANTCSFEEIKNHRDAVVTMVFIGGLLSVDTRKRLLEKEDLTSKEALEQAEAFERVGVNAPHLKEGPQAVGIAEVRMRNRQPARRTQTVDQKGKSSKGPARRDLRCRVWRHVGRARE
ncbi:hypothetical protein COOONC_18550 [Cooperia oncophora]